VAESRIVGIIGTYVQAISLGARYVAIDNSTAERVLSPRFFAAGEQRTEPAFDVVDDPAVAFTCGRRRRGTI